MCLAYTTTFVASLGICVDFNGLQLKLFISFAGGFIRLGFIGYIC